MREETKLWLKQGLRDLETAKNSQAAGDFYASVFFSHQAAEKALKALYLEKRKEEIKTHSLVRLGKECEVANDLLSRLRKLSPEYILTRYPNAAGGPVEDLYDKPRAKFSLETATKVLKWIKKQLKE